MISHLHDQAGEVIGQLIRSGELCHGDANGICQRLWSKNSVGTDTIRQAVDTERLSSTIGCLGDPVGTEDEDVPDFEWDIDLIVGLAYADAEREIVSMNYFTLAAI